MQKNFFLTLLFFRERITMDIFTKSHAGSSDNSYIGFIYRIVFTAPIHNIKIQLILLSLNKIVLCEQ